MNECMNEKTSHRLGFFDGKTLAHVMSLPYVTLEGPCQPVTCHFRKDSVGGCSLFVWWKKLMNKFYLFRNEFGKKKARWCPGST